MSDILIRGMEMSTDVTLLAISPDGTVDIISGQPDLSWKTLKQKAISVPPHGRLIDAGALFRVIREAAKEFSNSEYGEGNKDGLALARELLLQAPTIIPASGGQEDE